MCDCPARGAANHAKAFLPIMAVHLVDDTVNVIGQARAAFADRRVGFQNFVGRPAEFRLRVYRKTPVRELFEPRLVTVADGFGQFPRGIGEHLQVPRSGHRHIELAERACRRIPGVGEHRLIVLFPGAVQGGEVVMPHVYLAADFDDIGCARAQGVRNVGDRRDVVGNILADGAVAAGCRLYVFPAFVAERDGQAVDLGFGDDLDGFVFAEAEKPANPGDEIFHVLCVKGIVERQHGPAMGDLAKSGCRGGADIAARAVAAYQVRELRFDCRV